LRSYLFTDRDRERLRAWLESGVEDDGTRMIFVAIRRSLSRIVVDVDLMVLVLRRLRAEDRLMGRARLPEDLGRVVRGLEAGLRGRRKLS
jgi:Flp pilus assembly protein TadB